MKEPAVGGGVSLGQESYHQMGVRGGYSLIVKRQGQHAPHALDGEVPDLLWHLVRHHQWCPLLLWTSEYKYRLSDSFDLSYILHFLCLFGFLRSHLVFRADVINEYMAFEAPLNTLEQLILY